MIVDTVGETTMKLTAGGYAIIRGTKCATKLVSFRRVKGITVWATDYDGEFEARDLRATDEQGYNKALDLYESQFYDDL